MNNFRELLVWQKAVTLTTGIYEVTKAFPIEERFGLVSQMQRCATSIPSNIAEGAGRNSAPAFKHFLSIALGSAYELETQVTISKNLKYLNNESYEALVKQIVEVQKMIFGLNNTL